MSPKKSSQIQMLLFKCIGVEGVGSCSPIRPVVAIDGMTSISICTSS